MKHYCKKCKKDRLSSEFYHYEGKVKKPCKECRRKKVKQYQEKIGEEGVKRMRRKSYLKKVGGQPRKLIPKWVKRLNTNMYSRNSKSSKTILKGEGINSKYLLELFEKQKQKCYYSNLIMIPDDPLKTPSVDRLDSSKGYEKDNIVLCCRSLNYAKNDTDVEMFKSFIHEISSTIIS